MFVLKQHKAKNNTKTSLGELILIFQHISHFGYAYQSFLAFVSLLNNIPQGSVLI